jgi:hypothetical protein
MYILYVRGINVVFLYYFPIEVWDCSDSVVFFVSILFKSYLSNMIMLNSLP